MSSLKELQTRLLAAAVLYRTLKAEKMKLFFDIGETDDDCGFNAFLAAAKKLEVVGIVPKGYIIENPSYSALDKMYNNLYKFKGGLSDKITDYPKYYNYTIAVMSLCSNNKACIDKKYTSAKDKYYSNGTEQNKREHSIAYWQSRILDWVGERVEKAKAKWDVTIGSLAIPYQASILPMFCELETMYGQLPSTIKPLAASKDDIKNALIALPEADFNRLDILIEANKGSALTLVTNHGYTAALLQLEGKEFKEKLHLETYLAITQFFKSFMAVYPSAKQERSLQPCGQPLLVAIQQALPMLQELAQLETTSQKTTTVAPINQWEAKYQALQQVWSPFVNQSTAGTRCETNAIEINAIYNKYANQDWNGLRLIAGVQVHIDSFDAAHTKADTAISNYAKNASDATADLVPINNLVSAVTTLRQELDKVANGLAAPNKLIEDAQKQAVANVQRYTEIQNHLQMLSGVSARLTKIDNVDVIAAIPTQRLGIPANSTIYDVSDASRYALYIQDKADTKVADANDIQQAGLGDCYYLATAAALAQSQQHTLFDPQKGIIEAVMDSKGKKIQYFRVKLWLSIGTGGKMQEVQVQVLPELVANSNGDLVYHQLGDSAKKQREIWGAVLEMALVQIYGSTSAAASGDSAFAFSLLTGKRAIRYFFNDANSVKEATNILTTLQTNKGAYDVTFSTPNVSVLSKIKNAVPQPTANPSPNGNLIQFTQTLSLFGDHAYTFQDINAAGEITLLNPHHGANKAQKLMLADIATYFSNITVYSK